MKTSTPYVLRACASFSSCALLALTMAACDGAAAPQTKANTTIPAGMITKGPATGTGVAAAKLTAKQGETITLVGRIGGSEDPFVADRAVFTIVDPSLKSCADMADPDHCTTPWDYCCEERGSLKRSTATIEFAGADGRPLKGSIRGMSGLDPLATVAVTGTVTERNDAGVLVVRATKVEVR